MASTTANDLIERAMVKARIIYPGESIPASKAAQVLNELNDMLESWALEELLVLADVLESFSLVVGQSEYTYGTGGNFNSSRPIKIRDESFIRSSGGGGDLSVKLYTLDTYRSRLDKTLSGTPVMMSYHPNYPLGKVYLWPAPSSTDPLHVRSEKIIASFTSLVTAVDLSVGYRRAIISNLAVEISPNFGKKVSVELAALAARSVRAIKGNNSTPVKPRGNKELAVMAGGGRGYNIITGSY